LRAYVVWVPKLGAQEKDVADATRFFPDGRGRHYWDEGGRLMQAFSKRLALGGDAWDIYAVYGPSARWDEIEPPSPDYWMHQLGPTVSAPAFDGEVFRKEALGRLPRASSR
jgi:hypothetical protein